MEQFTRGNGANVRVVDTQREEKNTKPVTDSEAEAMIKKFMAQQNQQQQTNPFGLDEDGNPLPPEEFRGFAGIEAPEKRAHDPRIDVDRNGEYHNTSWGSDGDIDLEITVTSTMPLPKR